MMDPSILKNALPTAPLYMCVCACACRRYASARWSRVTQCRAGSWWEQHLRRWVGREGGKEGGREGPTN